MQHYLQYTRYRRNLSVHTTDELIMEMCICMYMYTHRGILLSHKKKEILPFAATWIDLEGIILSEISPRNNNTQCYHLNRGFPGSSVAKNPPAMLETWV